jgi:hypothetical protein
MIGSSCIRVTCDHQKWAMHRGNTASGRAGAAWEQRTGFHRPLGTGTGLELLDQKEGCGGLQRGFKTMLATMVMQ